MFQVTGTSSWMEIIITREKQLPHQIPQIDPVTISIDAVNKATKKQEYLHRAETEVLHFEESITDEHHFISTFASGDTKDTAVLNVSGTMMTTNQSTL